MNCSYFHKLLCVALMQLGVMHEGSTVLGAAESDVIHFYVGTYTNGESKGIYSSNSHR